MAESPHKFIPGVKQLGLNVQVISGQGATYTLLPSQSGATVLFDRAAGIVYTLPVPQVGMYFDFVITVTATSNAHEVDTDAATTFLGGTVFSSTEATTPSSTVGPYFFSGNATSSVKISMNGTTTGGLIGSCFRIKAISATVWQISGLVLASGTPITTPFA